MPPNKKEVASKSRKAFDAWPYYEQDEIDAVVRVLKTGKVNYWTGIEGRQFEREFSEYVDCEYGVALANGTVALESALCALGIGAGDEVIVPSRSFIASASCVAVRDATPVMADVHPDSQNVTVESIEALLTSRTKAIIVVHFSGWPCDMDPIIELARKNNIKVIEDCAQAHGAEYKGRPVGSLGDVAAFSFCQDKILTTGGEGGMLTTNSKEIWERAWSYKDHGKSYNAVYNRDHPQQGSRLVHESFGTNWRMTEMQSAIGRIQLRKLAGWINKRRKHATILSNCFAKIPALRVTVPSENFKHSYYKYYVFLRSGHLKSNWNRDRVVTEINDEGIPCSNGGLAEMYLEAAFSKGRLGPKTRLPVARQLGETGMMLLVHPTLDEKDINCTCEAVEKVTRRACA